MAQTVIDCTWKLNLEKELVIAIMLDTEESETHMIDLANLYLLLNLKTFRSIFGDKEFDFSNLARFPTTLIPTLAATQTRRLESRFIMYAVSVTLIFRVICVWCCYNLNFFSCI